MESSFVFASRRATRAPKRFFYKISCHRRGRARQLGGSLCTVGTLFLARRQRILSALSCEGGCVLKGFFGPKSLLAIGAGSCRFAHPNFAYIKPRSRSPPFSSLSLRSSTTALIRVRHRFVFFSCFAGLFCGCGPFYMFLCLPFMSTGWETANTVANCFSKAFCCHFSLCRFETAVCL